MSTSNGEHGEDAAERSVDETTRLRGPQPRYDPITGKKLKQEVSVGGPIFDPVTGKRLIRKRRSRGLVVAVAATALIVVGGGAAGAVVWHRHSASVAAKRAEAADAQAKRQAEQARADVCSSELGPVYDALVAVDGRMDTGANISQFSDIVGTAASALNAVDTEAVGANNSALYDPLADLVGMYGAIYTGWNDCIFDNDYCEADSSIDLSGALTDVSSNLATLGSDMTLTEDPSSFDTDLDTISTMVTY